VIEHEEEEEKKPHEGNPPDSAQMKLEL